MNKLNKFARLQAINLKGAVLGLGLVGLTGGAFAAGDGQPDATTIAAAIAALGVLVAVVGNAKLLIDAAIKGFGYIRRAIGG